MVRGMKKYSESVFFEVHQGYSCCGIFKEAITSIEEEHEHEFVEIIYVLNGRATQHINSSTFEVGKGDLLFVNYGSTHSFVPKGSFEYINIGFKPERLKESIKNDNIFAMMVLTSFDNMKTDDERLFSFYGVERREIEQLLDIMLIESNSKKENKEIVLENCLNILITLIVNKIRFSAAKKDDWQKIIRYIEENLKEKLTLEDLAKLCYYNASYFSRMFKEKLGISLSEFITNKRLEKAKKLLLEKKTIDYIVENVGFSSKKMLYKSFLERENMSISEFREKNKLS